MYATSEMTCPGVTEPLKFGIKGGKPATLFLSGRRMQSRK